MSADSHISKLDQAKVEGAEDLVKGMFQNNRKGEVENGSLSQTLGNFVHIVRDNRWIILVLVILAVIAGIFKAYSETPIYQARLTMAVEPSSYRRTSQTIFDPFAYRFYETQYELLKSRSVAERVVDRLALVDRPSSKTLLTRPSVFRSLLNEFGGLLGVKFHDDLADNLQQTELSDAERETKRQWLTRVIQGGVSVSGGEKTNLVQVTFNSIDPEFSAEIANALVDAYIEQGLDSQLNRSQQTSQWLSQRLDDLRSSLDSAQAKLNEFLLNENLLESSRNSQIDLSLIHI